MSPLKVYRNAIDTRARLNFHEDFTTIIQSLVRICP